MLKYIIKANPGLAADPVRDGPAADGGQADGAGVHGPLQRRVLGRAGQQDTRLPVQRPQVRRGDHVLLLR